MGNWEWILVPTLIGGFTGVVLSNFNCQRIGGRLMGFAGQKAESALGGFFLGALIGLVIGVLSGPGGGKRWLTGLGTGGTVGLLSGWFQNEEGEGLRWYLGLLLGAGVGCLLRLLVFFVETRLLPGIF